MDREQEIKDELIAMNSPLAGMSKTMPYQVPVGYFEDFTLTARLLVAEQKLPDARSTPHDVPEGYFDSLPAQLLQRVNKQPQQPAHKPKTIWLNVRRMAAAAVVLIAVGIGGYNFFSKPATLSIEQQLSAIPQAELMAYVQENAYDFDTENIINSLQSTGTQQDTGINPEDIESYLQQAGWQ